LSAEGNWVQETIDIRLIIHEIIGDHQATDTDLKALAHNVERLWKVSAAHATRVNELADQVQALRSVAFAAAGFTLGGVLLAFAWWATS
jgi:hypothetical protein